MAKSVVLAPPWWGKVKVVHWEAIAVRAEVNVVFSDGLHKMIGAYHAGPPVIDLEIIIFAGI